VPLTRPETAIVVSKLQREAKMKIAKKSKINPGLIAAFAVSMLVVGEKAYAFTPEGIFQFTVPSDYHEEETAKVS